MSFEKQHRTVSHLIRMLVAMSIMSEQSDFILKLSEENFGITFTKSDHHDTDRECFQHHETNEIGSKFIYV